MYWLDTTILAFLLLGAIFGALSGLLLQLARLVGFAIALYTAIRVNDGAADFLQRNFVQEAEPWVARTLAYIGVFLLVYLTIFVLTLILERGMRAARLQAINRVLGAALGALKAGLILGAIFLGVVNYPHPATRDMMRKSILAPALARGTESLVVALVAEYRQEFNDGLEDLTRSVRSALEKTERKGP
jgi:membrane protein required for colicin V production